MFNRYWREYPWLFQFLQFIILVFIFGSFFTIALIPQLSRMFGIAPNALILINENSPRRIVHIAVLFQFIGALGTFFLPAFLFGYFTHPRPLEYLGLRKPGKPIQLMLVICAILGFLPVTLEMTSWLKHIHLAPSLQQLQEKNDRISKGILTMPAIMDLLSGLFVFAITTAIFEELFFRGVMFRLAMQKNRSYIFSISLTALVFALFHFNVYGFPAILISGMLLGLIYYLTGSLWMNIAAHMLFNGIQIVLSFFQDKSAAAKAIAESDSLPWYLPAFGFVLCVVSIYLLWKNRTPLPDDWPNDFSVEELEERKQENNNV